MRGFFQENPTTSRPETLVAAMFAEAIVLLLLGLAAKCAFASATREGNPAAGAEEEAEFRRRRWWWHENRVCFLVLMAGRVPQFLFPDHVHVPIWGVFLAKLLFWWGEVTSPLLRDTLRLPLAEVPYPRDGLLTKGYLHTADPLFGVAILWLCSVPATLLALFLYIFCFLTVPGFSPAISLEMTARMVDYGLLGAYLFDCATGQLRPPDYSLTEEERLMTSTYHILDLHPVGPAAFPRGKHTTHSAGITGRAAQHLALARPLFDFLSTLVVPPAHRSTSALLYRGALLPLRPTGRRWTRSRRPGSAILREDALSALRPAVPPSRCPFGKERGSSGGTGLSGHTACGLCYWGVARQGQRKGGLS